MKAQTPDPAVSMQHVLTDDTSFRQITKTKTSPSAAVHLTRNIFKSITF